MNDRYLWDREGEPDPEIEALERTLSPLAHKPRPLDLDAQPPPAPVRARPLWRRVLAAAAVLGLALGAWRLRPQVSPPDAAPAVAWAVARVEGAPCVESRPLDAQGRLGVGQWLETDGRSRARVQVSDIGQVDVAPNTRLQLVGTTPDEHRLALARGRIEALVNAPPRLFLVETKAALAVDLGCAYTLEVDDAGSGLLHVTSGFVSLERGPRHSYVPAGAACRLRPVGPGTPYFDDAPAALQAALETFDFERPDAAPVLRAARAEDSLTLWHLLSRVPAGGRRAVITRLAQAAPPPAGVTPEGIAALDAAMLDAWREGLEPRWLDHAFGSPKGKGAW